MLLAILSAAALIFAAVLSGCGGSANIPASTASGPRLYMAAGVYGEGNAVAMYSIDDTALPTPTFVKEGYSFSGGQSGLQIYYSGDVAMLSRGLRELELTYPCNSATSSDCTGGTYNSPQAGSGWAVELAGQDGGLLQLTGQPFVPLVPAVTCPSMKTAETFLFVTLPTPLRSGLANLNPWNPQLETAYGSVDISASDSTVTLANIKQSILPSAGGGTPANAPSSSVTGACSLTVYGNTVAIPPNPTITVPGGGTGSGTVTPQATMGIGPSGLLVEDSGSAVTSPSDYVDPLGAGTGAIGLPKPSSPVDTSSSAGAQSQQYLGFFYSTDSSGASTNWSSTLASFGFSSLPSTCAAVATQTSTMLFGGDFTGNNPAVPSVQSAGGFGNCDFAIDLGAQDSSTNGLFPAATVYVGSGFGGNATAHNFKAVAIVGQLNGKYAIFVIGADTGSSPSQAWGIYLLQSN